MEQRNIIILILLIIIGYIFFFHKSEYGGKTAEEWANEYYSVMQNQGSVNTKINTLPLLEECLAENDAEDRKWMEGLCKNTTGKNTVGCEASLQYLEATKESRKEDKDDCYRKYPQN